MSNLPTPSSFSRRRLLQYGGGLVGTSLMATVLGGNPRSPLVAHAQGSPLTPEEALAKLCLLYTSPSPRDLSTSRMPSSA